MTKYELKTTVAVTLTTRDKLQDIMKRMPDAGTINECIAALCDYYNTMPAEPSIAAQENI